MKNLRFSNCSVPDFIGRIKSNASIPGNTASALTLLKTFGISQNTCVLSAIGLEMMFKDLSNPPCWDYK